MQKDKLITLLHRQTNVYAELVLVLYDLLLDEINRKDTGKDYLAKLEQANTLCSRVNQIKAEVSELYKK